MWMRRSGLVAAALSASPSGSAAAARRTYPCVAARTVRALLAADAGDRVGSRPAHASGPADARRTPEVAVAGARVHRAPEAEDAEDRATSAATTAAGVTAEAARTARGGAVRLDRVRISEPARAAATARLPKPPVAAHAAPTADAALEDRVRHRDRRGDREHPEAATTRRARASGRRRPAATGTTAATARASLVSAVVTGPGATAATATAAV